MSRRFLAPVLATAVAVLLVSAAPSFAVGPVCGTANHNVCVTLTDFDPIAPGDAVGQDTVFIANNGGNTVNDVNLTLTGATFASPSGGGTLGSSNTSVAWKIKQLKADQSATFTVLVKSLPVAGPPGITTCANANWNENTRNAGRQDTLPQPVCENTVVSAAAGQTVVPPLNTFGLNSVKLGTNPGEPQVGKATIPLLANFQGTANIAGNAGNPDGYACVNDKVKINGKQFACRGGPFFRLNVLDSAGNSPTYPANNPILGDFSEPSGDFDGKGLPFAVFHAGDTGAVDGLATALCGSTVPDPPNGCFAQFPVVQNGITHFLVKWRHNARYH
jgi:hypothetical protein